MAKKEKPTSKVCKHCKSDIPYEAKVCPQCRKKQGGGILKWIVVVIVVLVVISALSSGGGSSSSGVTKVGTVSTEDSTTTNTTNEDSSESSDNQEADEAEADTAVVEEQTVFYVGDIIQDGDMQIVYVSSGVYTPESTYSQADEGYQYIYIELACHNTGDSGDETISFYSFECYADGYSVDFYYSGGDLLSATLSAGRSTSGYLYFTVPEDAEEIEIEYETNYWTEEKITFIYEGEQDSGYVVAADTTRSADAYSVGDIIETSKFTITYISCEEWESDNKYVQPADGYKYISLEFEFENITDSDASISFYSFYCYADGYECEACYYRDDSLSATLSSGRKAKGTVTFEVPIDAEVIEVEYENNYWTSSRIVFTAQ